MSDKDTSKDIDLTQAGAKPVRRRKRAPKSRMAPALERLNGLIFDALGPSQRDWLLKSDSLTQDGGGAGKSLLDRAQDRIERREAVRQVNLEAILSQTLNILPARVHDGELDEEWLLTFFDLSANCSRPDRQKIWARMLAQAIAEPALASLSGCRALAGVTSEVLEIFETFAGLMINNFVVRLDDEFFETLGFGDGERLILEEYGLLRTNRDMNRVFNSQKEDRFLTHLLYLDKALKITHEDPEKTLNIPSYRLTTGGASLARAVAAELKLGANTEYLVELVRLLQRNDFKIEQADILEYSHTEVVSRHSRFSEILVLES